MLGVIMTQDLGCIRYRGADPAVLRRLAERGERAQCDVPPLPASFPCGEIT